MSRISPQTLCWEIRVSIVNIISSVQYWNIHLVISYRYHGIITNYILTPKYPDNSGVDAGHEEKREKVEEEDLDTSVSKVCRVAPSWDTRGKIPEDVFNNTGKVVPIVEKGDSRQDDSFWQAEEDGGGPDEDEDEDNSCLGVHKGGEGLADSWNKNFVQIIIIFSLVIICMAHNMTKYIFKIKM